MKRGRSLRLLGVAAAAVLAVPSETVPAAAPPSVQQDWTRTVAVTAEDGFRMGNPAAPVRLVEFVSLVCRHCRDFARDGAPQLIDRYVRSGRVSYEVRSFPLDPIDTIASLVNRCAAPQHYFPLMDAILAEQEQWVGRLLALSREEMQELNSYTEPATMLRIVAIAQLDRIAAGHGVTPARLKACIADRYSHARLGGMLVEAQGLGVEGAPGFLVNGDYARGVHDWAALEPLLREGS
jgi:protein-disulfide isomerase